MKSIAIALLITGATILPLQAEDSEGIQGLNQTQGPSLQTNTIVNDTASSSQGLYVPLLALIFVLAAAAGN